jgi:hypothetical protein
MPVVNPGFEADMLERAATACRNASQAPWFSWVAPHLDALAVRLNEGMATHEPGNREASPLAESADKLKVAVCEYLLSVNESDPDHPFIPPTSIDWLGDGIVSAVLNV